MPKPLPPKVHSPQPAIAAAGLAFLALLAYANSFRSGFVFDNRVLLLEDTRLRQFSLANLALILQKPYWWPFADTPLYRPVTTLSYLLNYSFFGNADHPAGYHVVNLALHVAAVWLVFALVLRIARRLWPAVFVAALWAVHPLNTESVTNIVGRADLLAAVGVLGALYSHLRARDASGNLQRIWAVAAFATMTVGVFSKESAAAALGVIILYDLLWPNRSSIRELLPGWVVLSVPLLLFLIQRSLVLSGTSAEIPFVDNPIVGANFLMGRATALVVIARYVGLFLWPLRLSADYSFAQIPLATGSAADWTAWVVVAGLAGLTAAALKWSRSVFFCLAGAFFTFLPAANLLFPVGTIMAERLMYLPSAFLVAAVVAAIHAVADRFNIHRLASAVLVVAIVLCGVRTFERNADWRDDISLWTATVKAAPNSFKSHGSYAEALYESDPSHGNLDAVIREKETSLAILQGVPDPAAVSKPYREAAAYYLERGDWLQRHGGTPEAIASAYRRAAELGERYLALAAMRPVPAQEASDARLLVSTAYAHLQDGEKAVAAAREGAAAQPFNPMSYRTTAAALLNVRRLDDAAVELMTGFVVTGNQDLRAAVIDIYRSGLDAGHCATTMSGDTVALNVKCEVVRRHLCAAAARASQLQRAAGHADLASQVALFTQDAHCERP